MITVKIQEVIEGLRHIPDEQFSCENIYRFLGERPLDIDSISKYFYWSQKFYTRNLIYKDSRFEAMILCWEKGQFSPIHNHADQKCWMMVPIGKLHGQNFRSLELDTKTNFCRLEATDSFDLSKSLVSTVDPEEPIHQILNLPEFDERAVSLHIYSKPFDKCLKYSLETNSFSEVELHYTSVDGTICENIVL